MYKIGSSSVSLPGTLHFMLLVKKCVHLKDATSTGSGKEPVVQMEYPEFLGKTSGVFVR